MNSAEIESPPPTSGGFFSNRRNLILAAIGIGGVAGLFFLMRGGSGSGSSSGSAGASYSAGDLTLKSIADQLLAFRGESSIGIQGLQDSVESGNTARAAAEADLQNALLGLGSSVTSQSQSTVNSILSAIGTLSSAVGGNQLQLMGALENLGVRITQVGDSANYQISDLRTGQERILSNTELLKWYETVGNQDASRSVFNLARAINPQITWDRLFAGTSQVPAAMVGAGGYRALDMTRDAVDSYDGVNDSWSSLMSNGPIRYIG